MKSTAHPPTQEAYKLKSFPKLMRPLTPSMGTYVVLFYSPYKGQVVYSESQHNPFGTNLGFISEDWVSEQFEDCEEGYQVCLTQS